MTQAEESGVDILEKLVSKGGVMLDDIFDRIEAWVIYAKLFQNPKIVYFVPGYIPSGKDCRLKEEITLKIAVSHL